MLKITIANAVQLRAYALPLLEAAAARLAVVVDRRSGPAGTPAATPGGKGSGSPPPPPPVAGENLFPARHR